MVLVEQLYRGIARSTGARLIVDSSKEPHYSWILRQATDLDVRFLHLVRDPRAVAMSWRRPRAEPGLGGAATMELRLGGVCRRDAAGCAGVRPGAPLRAQRRRPGTCHGLLEESAD